MLETRLLTLAIVASAAAAPLSAQRGDDYSASRDATVNASGAKMIRIDARSGYLRVTGRPGITEARIKATAHTSEKALLEDIQLEAKREGDQVIIRAKVPELH